MRQIYINALFDVWQRYFEDYPHKIKVMKFIERKIFGSNL
jgi:hypothetical protein